MHIPYFRRPDGTRIKDLPAFRRAMPLVLRHRHEAEMFHAVTFDLSETQEWLRRYNATQQGAKATFFHIFIWAMARTLAVFPQLNRFAAGRTIYQRDVVSITFSVKKSRADDAPFVLVKLDLAPDLRFDDLVARIARSATRVRGESGKRGLAELELKLVEQLPAVVTSAIVRVLQFANRHGLLPGALIQDDALFTSLMVANVGSVGLDSTYHHLSDYGTCSLFATIGLIGKRPLVVGEAVQVRDAVTVRWTIDERVSDAYYVARAIEHLRGPCEHPEVHIGPVPIVPAAHERDVVQSEQASATARA